MSRCKCNYFVFIKIVLLFCNWIVVFWFRVKIDIGIVFVVKNKIVFIYNFKVKFFVVKSSFIGRVIFYWFVFIWMKFKIFFYKFVKFFFFRVWCKFWVLYKKFFFVFNIFFYFFFYFFCYLVFYNFILWIYFVFCRDYNCIWVL